MRISMDPTDRGFTLEAVWYKVFLDNIEQQMVVTADEEEGTIEQIARDENGNILVDYMQNRTVTKVIHGAVRVEKKQVPMPDGMPPFFG